MKFLGHLLVAFGFMDLCYSKMIHDEFAVITTKNLSNSNQDKMKSYSNIWVKTYGFTSGKNLISDTKGEKYPKIDKYKFLMCPW